MGHTQAGMCMGKGGESTDEWAVPEERKLRKSGNSTVLSMPPNILQEVRLAVGDDVELVANRDEGTITIRPASDAE